MKIAIEKNVVEFMPENSGETLEMETLWRVMVDCLNANKRLSPIGEFIPDKNNLARFVIEEIPGTRSQGDGSIAQADATSACPTCNK
ncbi:MAG: hypothetical protein RI601_01960 [Desulfurivibrionaceae bacterium]|nr:hypothetical protein [Desulfurivibrionaceae bacterium]